MDYFSLKKTVAQKKVFILRLSFTLLRAEVNNPMWSFNHPNVKPVAFIIPDKTLQAFHKGGIY